MIGQEQDSFGGGFSLDQSASMQVTQVNFWRGILDDDKILEMTNCQFDHKGDLIPWNHKDWMLSNVKTKEESLGSLCERGYGLNKVVMTFGMAPEAQQKVCSALDGKLFAPKPGSQDPKADMQQKAGELMNFLKETGNFCRFVHIKYSYLTDIF